MTISRLVEFLERILQDHGDLEIYIDQEIPERLVNGICVEGHCKSDWPPKYPAPLIPKITSKAVLIYH